MIAAFVRVALGAGALALVSSTAIAAPQKGARSSGKAQAKKEAAQASGAPTVGVTYALKDLIKAKSGEFCAPYGGESDCIQDIEICLAMVDRDGDPVRLCVNSTPEESGKGEAQARSARLRQ